MEDQKQVEEAAEAPKPIVSGDPENGFIVEEHGEDGNYRTHVCQAKSEEDAIRDAQKKWSEEPSPQTAEEARDDHAAAKRLNRDEVESMLQERDDKIADLETRLGALEAAGKKDAGPALNRSEEKALANLDKPKS